MRAFGKVVFALTRKKSVHAVISTLTNAEARTKKGKGGAYPQAGFSASETPVTKDRAILGNQTISIPTLLTIPVHLLRGTIQDTLHGWHQSHWILLTIRRTWFWILVAHDQLDRERQSERSTNVRCIMASRQNFAFAISPLCLPTLRQKLVWKVVLLTFRQHIHVLPKLMCLRRETCLS